MGIEEIEKNFELKSVMDFIKEVKRESRMDIEARLKQINANSHYGLYPRRHKMEVKKMTFEESKEILKKSIDTSDTINQVIENFIQSIYAKGYDDALNNMLAPETIEEDKKSTSDYPQRDCADCRFDSLDIDDRPCRSCYFKDERPCFRPIERSAAVNGKEEKND